MSLISKNASKMRCALSSARTGRRQHAPHLRLEVVPLSGAVEVLEHGEAALEEIRAKRLGFAIGEVPEAGLPHERNGVLEQLGIVEREDEAAVGSHVERRELVHDRRQVLFRAR